MIESKCAVLKGPGLDFEIETRRLPEPNDYEAVLKVESCAVCGSDVRIRRTGNDRVTFPAVMGHEVAGTCYRAGKKSGLTEGKKYAVGADVPCGKCTYCRSGRGNLCSENVAIGYQLDGGYAEYLFLNETTCAYGPINEFQAVSFAEASLAEPLACAINGVEKAGVELGDRVLVYGTGPLGHMLADVSRAYGASFVNAVELDETRRKAASKTFDSVYEATNGKYDVVFTANTSEKCQQVALENLRPGGRINFFGGLPGGPDAQPVLLKSNLVHYRELTVVGSHGSTVAQHATALHLIVSGKVDVKKYVTGTFPLDKINEAFHAAESFDGLRNVVLPHWR